MTTPMAAALQSAGINGQTPDSSRYRRGSFALGKRSYDSQAIRAITCPVEALEPGDAIAAELRRTKADPTARTDHERIRWRGHLHQLTQAQRSRIKVQRKEQRRAARTALQQQQQPAEAPPSLPAPQPPSELAWVALEPISLQVARQHLDPATYQRLVLNSETRRAAEITRRTGMAMNAGQAA